MGDLLLYTKRKKLHEEVKKITRRNEDQIALHPYSQKQRCIQKPKQLLTN